MWSKDPSYAAVAAHLPFTGPDGSATFIDRSNYATSVVRTGDVSISTAQSKFAGSSARFNGGRLTLTNTPAFQQIGGVRLARTIQLWVRFDSVSTVQRVFHLPSSGSAVNDMTLICNANGSLSHSSAASLQTTAAGVVAANTWYHISLNVGYVAQNANYLAQLTIDGVQSGSTLTTGGSGSPGGDALTIGAKSDGTEPFIGYLQDFQLSHHMVYPRSGAGQQLFYPPDGLLPTEFGVDVWGKIDPLHLLNGQAPASTTQALLVGPDRVRGNFYLGGTGRIVGTVKEKGLPDNLPLSRKVRLVRDFDMAFVDETWSDAAGNYVFNDIAIGPRYSVISYDYTNTYRAVIADNLQAEPMP